MRAPECLFGDPVGGQLVAFHMGLSAECGLSLKNDQVGILLTRSGPGLSGGFVREVLSPKGHEGVLVVFSRELLTSLLESFRPGLDTQLRELMETEGCGAIFAPTLPHDISSKLYNDFVSPPLAGAAQSFFLEAKTKELIAHVGFLPGEDSREFFCSRQRRLNADRVSRSIEYLRLHLDEPLDLAATAEAVGCSPSYLSRIFSSTTGFTLSQFFRKCRIEKAADMLVTGRYSVSEVAIEVGYQSLSHFSKAFQAEKGCLPSRFDAA
ncbi:MAG: AraC family transcriptional regulator [Verrucomicrobiales bacterium]|nr:AraC family transcriptional regulator [Verrucomicrobiales bacterium]